MNGHELLEVKGYFENGTNAVFDHNCKTFKEACDLGSKLLKFDANIVIIKITMGFYAEDKNEALTIIKQLFRD